MNKKADGNVLTEYIIDFLILIVFFVGMMSFVRDNMNGAEFWSDYYAKEISKIVNLATNGDEFNLDVQRATIIAKKNKVLIQSDIFEFNNGKNEICVRLSEGRKSCYFYFNNVDVVDNRIDFGVSKSEGNLLHFKIVKGVDDA